VIAFGAPGGWYYVAAAPTDVVSFVLLTMFVAVNQAFFMSLFFFVAAFFTPQSLDKKGVRRFIKDRLMRLGIPLAVYFFFLHPSVVYLAQLFKGQIEPGYFRFMAARLLTCVSPGPMWFVLALLMFTAVYVAVYVAVFAWRQRRGAFSLRIPFPDNRRILVFIVGIGFATFLLRLKCPLGTEILNLQIAYFPLYIAMFVFGIFAYRSSWLEEIQTRQTALWFRTALVLIFTLPLILVLGGALKGASDAFRGGPHWQAYVYAAWEPFVCVGISLKLVTLFRARLNITNRITQHAAKSSYTAYIIHPFFVVTGTYLAKAWPLPSLAIVLLVCPLVVVACFLSADLIRQLPLLNKIL
jgi:hypothetical protein